MEAFRKRNADRLEVSAGVAVTKEMAVLVANRLADVAIGSSVIADSGPAVVTEPIFRYRLVVVTAGQSRPQGRGAPASGGGSSTRPAPIPTVTRASC